MYLGAIAVNTDRAAMIMASSDQPLTFFELDQRSTRMANPFGARGSRRVRARVADERIGVHDDAER
jgi:hypothetical protein